MKRLLLTAVSVWTLTSSAAREVEVSVGWDRPRGAIREVNSVGQPPVTGWVGTNMFHHLEKIGAKYSRLHDVGGPYGGGRFVDIPNVFPDFDADETDPKNYRFQFTDKLLEGLVAAGCEPFYRLGVSIENNAHIERRHIMPPKDFAKWARICEHIIRHYTEGWANGYRMKITYWEIWNEPDLYQYPDLPGEEAYKSAMLWAGPFDEYIRLYIESVTYLKKKFPHLKFGGYGSCGFGIATYAPGGKRVRDFQSREILAKRFLKRVKETGTALDFFSFHAYDTAANIYEQCRYARRLVDEAGFVNTELSFNEWLCRNMRTGSAEQAAESAATLIGLQKLGIETAMIYDAKVGRNGYAPLFHPITRRPRKPYYAFLYFNELKKRGTEVETSCTGEDGVWALAAKGPDGRAALLIANTTDGEKPLSLDLKAKISGCRVTDKTRSDVEVHLPTFLTPRSVVLVRFQEVK